MALVTCKDILKPARAGRYGVAGIDVLDPISTEGVIRADDGRYIRSRSSGASRQ